MGYNLKEIKQLQTPYQTLGNSDALAEHAKELNQLTIEEMINLATQMILECPNEKLKLFGYAIEALRQPAKETENFYAVLSRAYHVKKFIFALLDPKNKTPHQMILDQSLDENLFKPFKILAFSTLKNNESHLVERLAATTPAEHQTILIERLNRLFFENELILNLETVFLLKKEEKITLISESPNHLFHNKKNPSVITNESGCLNSNLI